MSSDTHKQIQIRNIKMPRKQLLLKKRIITLSPKNKFAFVTIEQQAKKHSERNAKNIRHQRNSYKDIKQKDSEEKEKQKNMQFTWSTKKKEKKLQRPSLFDNYQTAPKIQNNSFQLIHRILSANKNPVSSKSECESVIKCILTKQQKIKKFKGEKLGFYIKGVNRISNESLFKSVKQIMKRNAYKFAEQKYCQSNEQDWQKFCKAIPLSSELKIRSEVEETKQRLEVFHKTIRNTNLLATQRKFKIQRNKTQVFSERDKKDELQILPWNSTSKRQYYIEKEDGNDFNEEEIKFYSLL